MRVVVSLIAGLLCWFHSTAQVTEASRHIAVSGSRTTSVVFPSAIVSVDRGSERIIVQKSIANILRVKADAAFSDTTSLTVITADGKLYSFLVHFEIAPVMLSINLASNGAVTSDTSLIGLAGRIMSAKNYLHGIRWSEGRVQLAMLGIYTTGELVACKLKIKNASSLSYQIGGLQVYSKDMQTGRRRSTQERLVEPLLSFKPETVVRQKSTQVLIIILPKPALSYSKSLRIALSEKEGERNLSLTVSNRNVVNAVILP